MPKNSDNTATMEIGTYPVVVTVNQVGKVAHDPAVNPFNFPLTLTSLDKQNGGQNGGYNLTLTGTGYPMDITKAKISICGKLATILSINNIEATIIVPSCETLGNATITISDGTTTSNTLPF